ncbi:fatty acid hydroxylase [Flavobacterium limnosediminis JC2902]|uniref:Fatty acid hydroxylase n=1 Tax=Flavobacterium limnosediminis JC2902 TaxID=1341181 RepID=V6SPR7_9FLAO|nr:sterol desaturase family protein [Flavobacterium limnosediminis]ESU26425.1 fatty acid hydroxylase [Flavobacterium limnosediminis JC2902]
MAKRAVVFNEGQARLFENKYLEMLTKGNPILIWSMYIPILAYLIFRANTVYGLSGLLICGLFVGGMLYWTFFEYLAHRYLFHMVSENIRMKKVAYVMHGNHHEYPKDKTRLFMPPVPSLILSSVLFGLHYLLLWDYNWAFFPGFMFGYLLYASMHYAIHAIEPPFEFMRPLWRNHQMHHYRNEHLGYGVSNTFWDKIFGTTFDLRKHKEDKEKADALKFDK